MEQARKQLLSAFLPVKTETVALEKVPGRVLAEDFYAPFDLPIFNNSSMDGFAVITEDTLSASPEHPVRLSVIGEIPAGAAPTFTLVNGQAVRIMTGAPLPEGANAVVRVEDTDQSFLQPRESLSESVLLMKPVNRGENVRKRGADIRKGELLLTSGSLLTPQAVGVLAMCGKPSIQVYCPVRVALIITGSELLQPGEPLKPGRIYDANSYFLNAFLQSSSCEVIKTPPVPDDFLKVEELFDNLAAQHPDLILTSAGISVGSHDPIRTVLQKSGNLEFWRVNVRPGKPLSFGHYRNVPLIALPGNPVSAYVTYMLFVQPVIRKMSGLQELLPRVYQAILQSPVISDGRESYLRGDVQFDGNQYLAIAQNNQESSHLASLTRANALLIVPSGVKSLPTGSKVDFLWVN
ncbi:MAG: gephyrin-like molybdotransferase Glp [Anaerolineaceae bacterium]